MTTDKLVGALSLCRRAGKLVCGTDAVKKAVLEGKANMVLLTADTAQRTQRQILWVCESDKVPVHVIKVSMDTLAPVLGKAFGVIAVCDAHMRQLTEKMILEESDI